MGPYRPRVELALTTPSQSEIGRSVWLGFISIPCGEVSILVISVFVLGSSELYTNVWMDIDPGMGPHRP